MQYTVGKTGRVVVARLYEGEDLHQSIAEIVRKEDIRCASVLITGGFRSGDAVVGPKCETPTIKSDFQHFDGPAEVFGVGTLFWEGDEPKMHMHSAIGKRDFAMIGCARKDIKIFLILEVTIIELIGIDAQRKFDEKSGFSLLTIDEK